MTNALTKTLTVTLTPAQGKDGGKYNAKHAAKVETTENGERVVYYVSRYAYPTDESKGESAPKAEAKAPAKRKAQADLTVPSKAGDRALAHLGAAIVNADGVTRAVVTPDEAPTGEDADMAKFLRMMRAAKAAGLV